MVDFTIEDTCNCDYSVGTKFGWWCLEHNFDVVATILTMSSLSWQKGFDAGRTIANFAPENANPEHS